ncbi:purine and uridine phosphorylase [Aureobasidium pullulans]|nr:purine and uridine phosphorylase [Aureobasidium pullulans]
MTRPSQTKESYNIGILCALPTEKAAVEAVLDEEHESFSEDGDDNHYTLGKMAHHNVVVACMPSMGKASAASVVKDMSRSFSLRFGLMVGIGGGVWSEEHDIRLGDVVVSQPDGEHGGVVQWDFGKMQTGGVFRRTGSLNKPPPVLRNAVMALKVSHLRRLQELPRHLQEMLLKSPGMSEEFGYQGMDEDRLFESTYDHKTNKSSCMNCDKSRLVQRPVRKSTAPEIHYGNIASGDEVMKDAITRDRIARDEGVICFEMEAAGLMDILPCIVIRGVCDYADSHKNKKWQPYAASTAAAYAKELLSTIKEHRVVPKESR